MITRRQFSGILGTVGCSAAMLSEFWASAWADDASSVQPTAPGDGSQMLRVIAYNVLACRGWPSDRPAAIQAVRRKQMATRMALELALYDPDIINFSESPSESIAQEIADLLEMHHVRFPSGGNWPGTILSKYPIIESENVPLGFERPADLFTRHWGRAVLQLPDGQPLVVHSAHLYPGADPKRRLQEIPAMLAAMQSDLEAGKSMILMGDLNHRPSTQESQLWQQAGWVDTFDVVGKGDGLTINALEPKSRIDYVMAAGPLARQVVESRPLFERAFRLNPADPHAFALSDHVPQFASFDRSIE